MHSALPVAGFAVIEAATIEEAVEMVSRTPCAVAHGVVEVWPLVPTVQNGRPEPSAQPGATRRSP